MDISPKIGPSTPKKVETKESVEGQLNTDPNRSMTNLKNKGFVPPKAIPETPGPEITKRVVTEKMPKKEDSTKESKGALIKLANEKRPEMVKKLEIICRRELNGKKIEWLTQAIEKNDVQSIDNEFCRPFTNIMGDVSRTHKNYHEIFINERSKFIANLLIDSEGKMSIDLIDTIKDLINKQPLGSKSLKAHNQLLLKTLDAITSNSELVKLINNLEEPGKNVEKSKPLRKQNIQSLVRATLGLDEETQLTSMHTKQAILSAILTDLRQGEMGSCFATSMAIMVHDQNPLQVATELKQMIESGVLKKEIDGTTQNFHIPKIFIPSEYEMKEGFVTGGIVNFLRNPGIKKAVAMAGLDINEDKAKLEKMLNEELSKQGDSKKPADILKGFMHQLAMHKAGLESIDFDNKAKFDELTWASILSDKEFNRIQEKLQETNLSDNDRKELTAKGDKISNELRNLLEEKAVLAQAMDAKFGTGSGMRNKLNTYEDFKQKLEMNFMAAEGENSILRSWEFSIAALGRSESGAHMKDFNNLLINREMVAETTLDNLLERLWNKFVIFFYDQLGSVVKLF